MEWVTKRKGPISGQSRISLHFWPFTESEELRAYQLHMTDSSVTSSTFNTRIDAPRFFFGMTCRRKEMKQFTQFRTLPRKLPIVLSVEKVSDVLLAAPGPGLKYRAALGISYGVGLNASEVCKLKIVTVQLPQRRSI